MSMKGLEHCLFFTIFSGKGVAFVAAYANTVIVGLKWNLTTCQQCLMYDSICNYQLDCSPCIMPESSLFDDRTLLGKAGVVVNILDQYVWPPILTKTLYYSTMEYIYICMQFILYMLMVSHLYNFCFVCSMYSSFQRLSNVFDLALRIKLVRLHKW